ncbi:hypothetical protein PanWU01x14_341510 [Parasponia andersonii]|uniref:Uncharacterized protein n=1 Tax=Parasponia andersonii TaxID=3476 RepID=A0A2P5AE43_PARAD|nr:hypothetical protein PanWU01x14_341510 [Parasponia andersonii]
MDNAVREGYWSETNLEFVWISITLEFIDQALREFRALVGEAAAAVILVPNYGAATKIKRVTMFDYFGRSGPTLVKNLQWAALQKANLVITIINYDTPILDIEEIELNAVTISLGEDGLPIANFDRLVAFKGLIICDDVHVIESSNVNSLGLYYSNADLE